MRTPEPNVAFFAFLLHYPWEFLQVPFFAGMEATPHWDAVKLCSRAAIGDAGIALAAFWVAALVVRSRAWLAAPDRAATAAFVLTGVAITIVFERLATGALDRWTYSELMPVVPVVQVGVVPLVQWLVLPFVLIWVVRRQMAGAATLG